MNSVFHEPNLREDLRVLKTLEGLTNIANYLASFPGRKNLIWISGGFPFYFGHADHQARYLSTGMVLKAAQAVSSANMAIYPVDARGLLGPADIVLPSNEYTPARSNPYLELTKRFAASIQTMQVLADRTGRRAFYNTNDIMNSIRSAVQDSAIHYMIGFYARENEWNTSFQNIEVNVKRTEVSVRHRN